MEKKKTSSDGLDMSLADHIEHKRKSKEIQEDVRRQILEDAPDAQILQIRPQEGAPVVIATAPGVTLVAFGGLDLYISGGRKR